MINPPLASTAVGVVHHSRSGMASGINNTFRQVGIATGVAGLGAVFQHQIAAKTTAALGSGPDRAPPGIARRTSRRRSSQAPCDRSPNSFPAPAHAALLHAYRVGFTGALTTILLIAVRIAFLGAICAFALIRSRDFVGSDEPGARPATPEAAAPSRRLTAIGLARVPRQPRVLEAGALQHRDARVARIGWIFTGAAAQREAGAARVADDLLMGAAVAEPRADAARTGSEGGGSGIHPGYGREDRAPVR